jgi:oligopeptide transport system ATP-binding protein
LSAQNLLEVSGLRVEFRVATEGSFGGRRQTLKAVDDVGFTLATGETLGIVGESGCGKSSLARGILRLTPLRSGSVRLNGEELTTLNPGQLRQRRQMMQIVFQDPLASLDPRMTVGEIISEPLVALRPELSRRDRSRMVEAMMERVGLLPNQINRYPHEFSGGQCQRIGIARALILRPKLLICDEPVSALDVSIQAQIVNLLMELQQEMGLSMLFISHDLSIVKQISHRVMVMYLGRCVEIAGRDSLYRHPRHPYTRALIESIPIPDPDIERATTGLAIRGDLPSPLYPPSGCAFRTRCPLAVERCASETPELEEKATAHRVACHHPI